MESSDPSSSAENRKKIGSTTERQPQTEVNTPETTDPEVSRELGEALMYFKTGNKRIGTLCIQYALKKAEKKGVVIPLSTVEAVMDGRAPSSTITRQGLTEKVQEALAKPERKDAKQKSVRLLDTETQSTHEKIIINLEPWRAALEKKLREIIEEVRNKCGIELDISPELAIAA